MHWEIEFRLGCDALLHWNGPEAAKHFDAVLQEKPAFLPAMLGRLRAIILSGDSQAACGEVVRITAILEERGDTERIANIRAELFDLDEVPDYATYRADLHG